VGGLAHYLEEKDLPTTSISLIREHTEKIKPPRALWVPFELGRPLGVPGDADFQKNVLKAALNLFTAESGPVLEDYNVEAPAGITRADGWACPVNLEVEEEDLSEIDSLKAAFKKEMNQMRSWYDMAVEKRGRTTVGTSGVDVDDMADFICTLLDGKIPENPNKEYPLPLTVNLVTDDIKAYYSEALTAQPGQDNISSQQLVEWFYTETAAGKAMYALRKICAESDDKLLSIVSKVLVIPANMAKGGGIKRRRV
jgi:hypothetical protein